MPRRTVNTARLGVFWFGIQMVWGALLGVSLQARATELTGHAALDSYRTLAVTGAAVAAIAQIAAGLFSDRMYSRGGSRTALYLAGALAGAAGILWFYLAHSFGALLAAVVVLQLGINVAIGPYQAAIPDTVEPRRMGNASSWMAALQSAGNAAGAILASLVADARVVAGIIAAVLVSTCAVTAAHVRRLPRAAVCGTPFAFRREYADLFVSRGLMYLGFYTLLGYLFFFIGETLQHGSGKAVTGYTLLAVTAAGTAGAALAAKPADAFDQRAVASLAGGAFAAAILILLFAGSVPAIICVAVLAGVAWGVFLTADWALGCRFVPASHAATALAIWNLALLVPQVFAPLVASVAIALLKSYALASHAAFIAAIVEIVAGSAWIWRLPAENKRG